MEQQTDIAVFHTVLSVLEFKNKSLLPVDLNFLRAISC